MLLKQSGQLLFVVPQKVTKKGTKGDKGVREIRVDGRWDFCGRRSPSQSRLRRASRLLRPSPFVALRHFPHTVGESSPEGRATRLRRCFFASTTMHGEIQRLIFSIPTNSGEAACPHLWGGCRAKRDGRGIKSRPTHQPRRCGGGSKGEGGHLRASELSAFPLGTLFGSFFPCRKKELPAAQAKSYCTTKLRCK